MTIKNFSPYKVISEAAKVLKPNEKRVVLARFGIGEDHKTLSAIGKTLKLSRERIRQIEREALKKVAREVVANNSSEIAEILTDFDERGGISSHEKIAEKFLEKDLQNDKNQFNSLYLIFVIMPEIIKIDKTKELEAGWILATLKKEDAVKVISDWVSHLQKAKKPQSIEVLIEAHPNHKKHKIAFLSNLPEISKKIIKTEDDLIGLANWPEINPRNVRDKIYFVFKKENKPLHFAEIARKIMEQGFDQKKIVRATVHNELIADSRFVLIGRGIYALREWGYSEGTVADVISEVLAAKPAGMKANDIVVEVLKKRAVKKNTVLINLQTKPIFKRVGVGKFALK